MSPRAMASLVTSLLLLLCLSTLHADEREEKRAQKLLRKAEKYMDAGDFRKATQALEYLLQKYPETETAKPLEQRLAPGGVLWFHPLQVSGPPEARADLVFVGEGYTNLFERQGRKEEDVNGDGLISEDDQRLFGEDVQLALKIMKGEAPFREYWNTINFYQLNVVSPQTGCDTPERGVERETCFDAKFENRVMSVSWNRVAEKVRDYVEADYIVVLVHRGEKGSAIVQSGYAVVGLRGSPHPPGEPDKTWGPEWGLQSLIHELGHAIGKSGEEYTVESPFGEPSPVEPGYPNITCETRRDHLKWRHWIEDSTPIPTTAEGSPDTRVGLFEGANSMEKGFYRPYDWCAMRGRAVGGENPYCPVCREQLVLNLYSHFQPFVKLEPADEQLHSRRKGTLTLSAEVCIPAGTQVRLDFILEGPGEIPKKEALVSKRIDGARTREGVMPVKRKLYLSRLEPGEYTLTLLYQDLTPFVRKDPEERLKRKHVWKIGLQD